MQARTMIAGVLTGGPLLGLALGLAANPHMIPPPEPPWRQHRPDPIFAEPQPIAEAGPQDLSPTWYLDRMPTWKRRAAERAAAADAYRFADYPDYEAPPPEPPPEADLPPESLADSAPGDAAMTGTPGRDAQAVVSPGGAERDDAPAPAAEAGSSPFWPSFSPH
ncbi:MAG: hypothetical protein JF595_04300 [Sphingomonadales bacterium]|nr:hypothetical protein [Sphingomonadales bacterium]